MIPGDDVKVRTLRLDDASQDGQRVVGNRPVAVGAPIGPSPADRAGQDACLCPRRHRATAEGLSTAPLSETVEIAWPRYLLRQLLSDVGEPFVVVRLGYVNADKLLPATPRRPASETITFDD